MSPALLVNTPLPEHPINLIKELISDLAIKGILNKGKLHVASHCNRDTETDCADGTMLPAAKVCDNCVMVGLANRTGQAQHQL